jgi:hypothetical protein
MNYLFENKELIFLMINHLNRRAISEALYKILISQNVQIQDTEIKTEIFNKVLDAFDGSDIEKSQNICDLISDCLQQKKNYNLIVKNGDLFHKFHEVAINNFNYDSSVKDYFKILMKLNENFLKDMSSNPNSQIHLTFNEVEYPNDIHAMIFEEENTERHHNLDNDINSLLYIFNTISKFIESVCQDFINSCKNEEQKEKKSYHKSLGVKRYAELEYLKSIIEVIVYGIASGLNLDSYLNKLSEIIVSSGVFKHIVDSFFEYEWNNMYQKVFESVVSLLVYKTSPVELIEDVKILI